MRSDPEHVNSVSCSPVLDVFPDDEEVGLDEPLDDLTVPLLPGGQFPGDGHGLKGRANLVRKRLNATETQKEHTLTQRLLLQKDYKTNVNKSTR